MWTKRQLDHNSNGGQIKYVPLTQLDKISLANHIKELVEDFTNRFNEDNHNATQSTTLNSEELLSIVIQLEQYYSALLEKNHQFMNKSS